MAAMLEDDDFDQFDKPGAERSRRRRTKDDDWDSELEDDLLEEDFLPGKKTSLDLSDEELNDDLLQSDDEELEIANYSSQGVTVSLNATTGGMSSFDLTKSINEENAAEEAEFAEEAEEVYEEEDTEEAQTAEDVGEAYEESYEAADEQVEYEEEEAADEVLDLEINEPLDEFQDEEYSQAFKRQKTSEEQAQYAEETAEESYVEDMVEDAQEQESQELVNEPEEVIESQELPSQTKESFDEDDEDEEEEESGRLRFKTERKEGTIIRLSDTNRERRNIPETLELSEEAKASLMEFEEMERQRKMGHYGGRRGGRRGGNHGMHRGMRDQRNDHDRRNMRDRHNQGQPVRSLYQQQQHQQHQHIQPLLPMPRSRNQSSNGQQSPQLEKSRIGNNTLLATPSQQPKNIHINPHFKGNVAPVQVPLLPVPNQPRPPMGPPRFPGMPEFQPPSSPVPGNFNPPPRMQEPWRNQPPPPPPPPQPEREQFFMGEPRFPNHHMFDQRNPPPGPPPPLMNTNHPVPNQNVPPFNPPGQGFNQPPRFNQPQSNFNPPGPQPGFNPPGPQGGFNQPGFNQPGPQSGFNPPGPQPVFNPPGNQPGFNPPNFGQPGPQPGFNQSGPPPPFNPPGPNQPNFNQLNTGPQPGFNQPGSGLPPNFPQPSPGPQPAFNSPGFSRERPVRMNMPSPNQMGMPPFNQPSGNIRPFAPPRQQYPPGPGQPFMPHSQSNMQGNMQHPIQPLHQQHHHGGPPRPPGSNQQPPFRAQNPQVPSHRMPGQQRHGPPKPRQGTSGPNMAKAHNPQALHQRNSNLRELPIAPSNSAVDMNRRRAAQVKPLGTATPQNFAFTHANKSLSAPSPVKQEPEEQFPDEDEETRKYRLKIEEQKRLREEILRQKELRRQQQAGARKKELLERLSHQTPNTAQQAPLEADKQTVKVENNSNPITTHVTEQPRPNVKNRLVAKKSDSLVMMTPQKIPLLQSAGPGASKQVLQKKAVRQPLPNRVAVENQLANVQPVRPAGTATPFGQQQTLKIASVQGRPQEQRPTGAKRTVMQRSNSNSGDQAHLAPKVRVIKLAGSGENIAVQASESSPQVHITQTRVHPQQRIPPQQRQQYQQRMQQQKTGPVRKVTLGKGSVQQQQQNLPYQQQYQANARSLSSLTESSSPQVVNSIHGLHPPNKVIMRGRGRGAGGQMGRGRLMPNKQNLRVVECKPQPRVVSVEGLSSSTNEVQLRNLLMSVGPIQNLKMFPVQRKAIATFEDPHHASQFQQRFHRHMIDLSHINVSLVSE